jgi:hypothetical protein
VAARPPYPSFPFFPFHYIPLYLTHRTLGTNGRAFGQMDWPVGHLPWPTGHTMAPLQKGCQGELLLHPTSIAKFSESFSKFLVF